MREVRAAGVAIPLDHAPPGGEQQREGEVGRCAVENARRVTDRNAARRSRRATSM